MRKTDERETVDLLGTRSAYIYAAVCFRDPLPLASALNCVVIGMRESADESDYLVKVKVKAQPGAIRCRPDGQPWDAPRGGRKTAQQPTATQKLAP